MDKSNLKVFKDLTCVHIKRDKLDVRVMKCVFISYVEGVISYKMWKIKSGGYGDELQKSESEIIFNYG